AGTGQRRSAKSLALLALPIGSRSGARHRSAARGWHQYPGDQSSIALPSDTGDETPRWPSQAVIEARLFKHRCSRRPNFILLTENNASEWHITPYKIASRVSAQVAAVSSAQ